MQDKEQNRKKLEAELLAIELDEQGHRLTDQEVEELMRDERKMDAYRTLFYARVASAVEDESVVDAEWQRLSRRHVQEQVKGRSHTLRYTLWGAAAACALALVLFVFYRTFERRAIEPVQMAFVTKGQITDVTLQTDHGDSLVITSKATNDVLSNLDARMDARGQLVYRQPAVADAEEPVQQHAISTPRGKDFHFILSDGTHVWLNSNSHIEYPSRFEDGERVVALKGEAYFDVAKDAAHPFVVKAGRMATRVLGTQFNISDYNGSDPEVTLVTGSVEVAANGSEDFTRIRPGQNAALKRDGHVAVRNVDTELYTAWKDGFFSFDNITLREAMNRITDWYDVEVVFDRPALSHLRLRYYNERTVPLVENIRILNELGAFTIIQQGNVLHVK